MNADPCRLLLHGYGAKTGQAFAHFIDPDREVWLGVDDSILAILERGPRSQRYRMTWDDVLANAIHEDGKAECRLICEALSLFDLIKIECIVFTVIVQAPNSAVRIFVDCVGEDIIPGHAVALAP